MRSIQVSIKLFLIFSLFLSLDLHDSHGALFLKGNQVDISIAHHIDVIAQEFTSVSGIERIHTSTSEGTHELLQAMLDADPDLWSEVITSPYNSITKLPQLLSRWVHAAASMANRRAFLLSPEKIQALGFRIIMTLIPNAQYRQDRTPGVIEEYLITQYRLLNTQRTIWDEVALLRAAGVIIEPQMLLNQILSLTLNTHRPDDTLNGAIPTEPRLSQNGAFQTSELMVPVRDLAQTELPPSSRLTYHRLWRQALAVVWFTEVYRNAPHEIADHDLWHHVTPDEKPPELFLLTLLGSGRPRTSINPQEWENLIEHKLNLFLNNWPRNLDPHSSEFSVGLEVFLRLPVIFSRGSHVVRGPQVQTHLAQIYFERAPAIAERLIPFIVPSHQNPYPKSPIQEQVLESLVQLSENTTTHRNTTESIDHLLITILEHPEQYPARMSIMAARGLLSQHEAILSRTTAAGSSSPSSSDTAQNSITQSIPLTRVLQAITAVLNREAGAFDLAPEEDQRSLLTFLRQFFLGEHDHPSIMGLYSGIPRDQQEFFTDFMIALGHRLVSTNLPLAQDLLFFTTLLHVSTDEASPLRETLRGDGSALSLDIPASLLARFLVEWKLNDMTAPSRGARPLVEAIIDSRSTDLLLRTAILKALDQRLDAVSRLAENLPTTALERSLSHIGQFLINSEVAHSIDPQLRINAIRFLVNLASQARSKRVLTIATHDLSDRLDAISSWPPSDLRSLMTMGANESGGSFADRLTGIALSSSFFRFNRLFQLLEQGLLHEALSRETVVDNLAKCITAAMIPDPRFDRLRKQLATLLDQPANQPSSPNISLWIDAIHKAETDMARIEGADEIFDAPLRTGLAALTEGEALTHFFHPSWFNRLRLPSCGAQLTSFSQNLGGTPQRVHAVRSYLGLNPHI